MSRKIVEGRVSRSKIRRPQYRRRYGEIFEYPIYITSLVNGLAVPMRIKDYYISDNILHRIYSIFIAILIVGLNGYDMYEETQYTYIYFSYTIKLNDILYSILLTFTNCFAILNMAFRGPRLLNAIVKKFKKIDRTLYISTQIENEISYYAFIMFVVFHMVYIGACVGSYLVWAKALGFRKWIYFSLKLYSIYAIMTIMLQIIFYADNVRLRFIALNESLVDSFLQWSDHLHHYKKKKILKDFFPKGFTKTGMKFLHMTDVINTHGMLCDIMAFLNEFFGIVVFLILPNVVVGTSGILNKIFLFLPGMPVHNRTFYETYGVSIVILYMTYTVFIAVSITNYVNTKAVFGLA